VVHSYALIVHGGVSEQIITLPDSFAALLPPWMAGYNLATADDRRSAVVVSMSMIAEDGSLRIFGAEYSTDPDLHEPDGVMRRDLVKIFHHLDAIVGAA